MADKMNVDALMNSTLMKELYAEEAKRRTTLNGALAVAKPSGAEAADAPKKAEETRRGEVRRDEYIPGDGEPEKSAGLYRWETDGDGNKKIVADTPDSSKASGKAVAVEEEEEEEEKSEESGPKKADDDKRSGGLTTSIDTNSVEAEIRRLKQQKQQTEQQLGSAGDDQEKRRELEARLAQVNSELSSKDSEDYRKSRAVVTTTKGRAPLSQ